MARKIILEKTDRPGFEYLLLTGSCFNSFYIYQEDELEQAMAQLKAEHAKGNRIAYIGVPKKCTDGTYRLKKYMHLENGKVVYDEYSRMGLHVAFYVQAGRCLN